MVETAQKIKLVELFLYIIRGLLNSYKAVLEIHGGYVFGENRRFNRKTYNKAVKAAGIVDFNFHDLRHCAINNLRLAGNDHYKIKQASVHKTDSAFQRYNLVTEEEMKGMQWLDQQEGKSGTIDTYMDTTAKTNTL